MKTNFVETEKNVVGNWYEVELIHEEKSEYQTVKIFRNEVFGKMLVIDDLLQSSTRYEHIFNEMLVHGALTCCEKPEKILIIGGASCNTLKQVMKYSGVQSVTICDIDRSVFEICKKFIPEYIEGTEEFFRSGKAKFVFRDAGEFLKECCAEKKKFDAIILDGTDPVGAGENLYSREMFKLCAEQVGDSGIVATHVNNPLIYPENYEKVLSAMSDELNFIRPAYCAEPEFPGAMYTFLYAGKKILEIYPHEGAKGKYFNPELFIGAQMLPTFLLKIFEHAGLEKISSVPGACYRKNS